MSQVQTRNYINATDLTNKKQYGFSLIELLIAMFIGLFLLAGITSSYIHSKKSSIQRDQYSLLEDNGRLALEVMSKTLVHAGYKSKNAAPLQNNFIITSADVNARTCTGGVPAVLNTGIFPANSTVDSATGDSIGVIYLGDDDVFSDCSGGILPANCRVAPGVPTQTSRIYNSFFLDATDDTLKCAGSRDNAEQVIADGIENMQILYGIDPDGDNINSAVRYVSAANVNGLWNNITSIQIALLVRSEREVKGKAESITYSLLDTPVTAPNDKYQRAVFSTTVSIRNKL